MIEEERLARIIIDFLESYGMKISEDSLNLMKKELSYFTICDNCDHYNPKNLGDFYSAGYCNHHDLDNFVKNYNRCNDFKKDKVEDVILDKIKDKVLKKIL